MTEAEKLPEYSMSMNPFEMGFIAGLIVKEYPDPKERPSYAKTLLAKLEAMYMEMKK